MSYLGSWKIDDYLPIPVTTHRFSSGAAYAPTALTYSIYEDATMTGLDEDVDMTPASPFDSVTGFYLARRQLTAAAGFEKGKNYTVLIKATVDSVAAIAAHTFQIEAEVDANTVSASTVALEATLTAIKGAGWSDETLKAISDAVDAISGGGASVNEIWNELTATHTTVGSFAKAITDILEDTGVTLPALIAAIQTWASSAISASYTAGAISEIRGSSWSIPMTDLTLDSNKQQFSIKRRATDSDADAILFVDSATGLITLNGVSTGLTAADATLVYAGTTLTLTVKANVTAQLPVGIWNYGIQYVTAAGLVEEPYGGTFTVTADIVRATT